MELIRVSAGLPVAALLPLSLPRVREAGWLTILISAGYAALVLAPIFPEWQSWLLLVVTVVISLGVRSVAKSDPDWIAQTQTEGRTASWTATVREAAPLLAGVFLTLAAAATLGTTTTSHAVEAVLLDDRIAVIANGTMAAVFLGGIVVSFILAPFTRALGEHGEDLPSLKNAGTYIGWFERLLLFAFVFGGKPEAAAVALAAKSFARFPSLSQHHEGFAEYFLIGSLSSVTVALSAAVATRIAIGLTAF
jgi:hypothetical protein